MFPSPLSTIRPSLSTAVLYFTMVLIVKIIMVDWVDLEDFSGSWF